MKSLLLKILIIVQVAAIAIVLRAPCIFRADEPDMHKYSAILATTQPFRLNCIQQIKQSMNPFDVFLGKISGKSVFDFGNSIREKNPSVDDAMNKLESQIEKVLSVYEMSVGQFNELTENFNKNGEVKSKILLQTYFYRIAADLERNLKNSFFPSQPHSQQQQFHTQHDETTHQQDHFLDKRTPQQQPTATTASTTAANVGLFNPIMTQPVKPPEVPITTNSVTVSSSTQLKPIFSSSSPAPAMLTTPVESLSVNQKFARALHMIETERLRMRDFLKNQLKLRELPPRMADPDYLPAMCPLIQQTCTNFPHLAGKIVLLNGLPIEEFNNLQDKLRSNMFFRYQIQQELSRLPDQQQSTQSPAPGAVVKPITTVGTAATSL